ncbi:MAG: hypothetical protein ACK5PG_14325 [Lysobacterales bacterium]|jgi:hypothetical protein
MRVFVIGLITAGSFMMLSADTRGIDLPSAEWCSTGTLVPVAEFHFYPEAFKGLPQETVPRGPVFKMVGEFDDDYPTDPREEEEEEGEEGVRSPLPEDALPKMVGEFDDDYPTDPRDEEEDEESTTRVRSPHPGDALPKMVGEFDEDYPIDPREEDEEEVEQVRTALAMASEHCSQFTLAKQASEDHGEVIAVAEWPRSLVDTGAGRYSLKQGAAGLCLRCE